MPSGKELLANVNKHAILTISLGGDYRNVLRVPCMIDDSRLVFGRLDYLVRIEAPDMPSQVIWSNADKVSILID